MAKLLPRSPLLTHGDLFFRLCSRPASSIARPYSKSASIPIPSLSRRFSTRPNVTRTTGGGTPLVAKVGLTLGTAASIGAFYALTVDTLLLESSPSAAGKPSSTGNAAAPTSFPLQADGTDKRDPPPPSESGRVTIEQLGFGTVLGICTGVFVKKGLKTIAFIVGGVFVVIQYLHSRSYLSSSFPSWNSLASKYESTFDRVLPPEAGGSSTRLSRAFNAFMDFLLADFPGRATFVAGFVLGLRVG